jgi:CBS domain-containing protein
MTVQKILRKKGSKVISIRSGATIQEAVNTLVSHGVGALLVTTEGDEIEGIITERDILRLQARKFDAIGDTRVADVMTREVIICVPGETLEYVEDLMTERRIRHLPIMDQRKLVGIISIGDVVKAKAAQARVEAHMLTDYIAGKYPG